MLVIRDLAQVPQAVRGSVLAIGNFDGVHRGHRVLFDRVFDVARKRNVLAGVMIFEPHPREFFKPAEPHFRLTPIKEKLRLIHAAGFDFAVVLNFEAKLAALCADEFVTQVLEAALQVRHVVVGFDFLFGRCRSGSADSLKSMGKTHGFEVSVIDAQGLEGEPFSSSDVRKHLAAGDVTAAALILGHWWRVSGTVIEGERLGRKLGFPTANLQLPSHVALAHGIYAVHVLIGETRFDGVAYYGSRPAVGGGPALLEAHIFDFDQALYGTEISVDFVGFIRGDKSFETLEELTVQIERDRGEAISLLQNILPPWQ